MNTPPRAASNPSCPNTPVRAEFGQFDQYSALAKRWGVQADISGDEAWELLMCGVKPETSYKYRPETRPVEIVNFSYGWDLRVERFFKTARHLKNRTVGIHIQVPANVSREAIMKAHDEEHCEQVNLRMTLYFLSKEGKSSMYCDSMWEWEEDFVISVLDYAYYFGLVVYLVALKDHPDEYK